MGVIDEGDVAAAPVGVGVESPDGTVTVGATGTDTEGRAGWGGEVCAVDRLTSDVLAWADVGDLLG